MGEDVRRDVVRPVAAPVVLPWDVADTNEVAETEYGFVRSTFVLLALALGYCGRLGGLSRLVVELSAEGNVDTLLLVVAVMARDGGTDSPFCAPLTLPLPPELRFSIGSREERR